MGDKSKIQWTNATWNPVRGCSRVSAGCKHCYAEGVARRFAGPGQPYEGLVRIGKDGKPKAQWNGEVRFVAEHLADPLRWKKPRRVFVNSMSDLFHEALPFEQIASVFGVMSSAPRHTFQVLTKRPARAREFFDWLDKQDEEHAACVRHAMELTPWRPSGVEGFEWPADLGGGPWPLPNVWLGVSVEDQRTADERIPVLLSMPAAVRWVSYEPALGPVDFSRFMWPVHSAWPSEFRSAEEALAAGATVTRRRQALVSGSAVFLDWIVVGGESGPHARPFDLAWARSTVTACREAGVPVFVKQLGANVMRSRCRDCADVDQVGTCESDGLPCSGLRDRKGGDPSEWPEDLRVREWPT